MTILKESAPGNAASEGNLEEKIKDARNWAIFPMLGAKKSDFTPIYTIMEETAKEHCDVELAEAAEICRLFMNGEIWSFLSVYLFSTEM